MMSDRCNWLCIHTLYYSDASNETVYNTWIDDLRTSIKVV